MLVSVARGIEAIINANNTPTTQMESILADTPYFVKSERFLNWRVVSRHALRPPQSLHGGPHGGTPATQVQEELRDKGWFRSTPVIKRRQGR